MTPPRIPTFDGRNDVLSGLYRRGRTDGPQAFLQGEAEGHLDLPKALAGGFAGGLFAAFVPSLRKPESPTGDGPSPGAAAQDAPEISGKPGEAIRHVGHWTRAGRPDENGIAGGEDERCRLTPLIVVVVVALHSIPRAIWFPFTKFTITPVTQSRPIFLRSWESNFPIGAQVKVLVTAVSKKASADLQLKD